MNNVQDTLKSLRKSHWTASQTENAQTTLEFIHKLMNEHNFDAIHQGYSKSRYIQHNRSMTDGIDGVIQSVTQLTNRFSEFSYDVRNIHVDGNMVTVHSHATVKKHHRGNDRKGFNIMDTWRVENGQLTEHWDTIQPLDTFMRFFYAITGGSVLNRNGVF